MLERIPVNQEVVVLSNFSKPNKIFLLSKAIVGESSITKINKIKQYMYKKKINYLYVSASENVNWVLNIRGKDLPNSPLVNCKLIISNEGKLNLFINLQFSPDLKLNFSKSSLQIINNS